MKTSTFINHIKDIYYADTGIKISDKGWSIRRLDEGIIAIGVKYDITNLAGITAVERTIKRYSKEIQFTVNGRNQTGIDIDLMKIGQRYQKGKFAMQNYQLIGFKNVEY